MQCFKGVVSTTSEKIVYYSVSLLQHRSDLLNRIIDAGLRNCSMEVTQFRVGTHFKPLFGRLGAKNGYSLAVLHKSGSECERVCVCGGGGGGGAK